MIYEKHGVNVRVSREEDIYALGPRLREEDKNEIIASGHKDGTDAIRTSFALSGLRFTVELNGLVVGMFGCVRDANSTGANAWFLGSPELARMKKTFVKLTRVIFDMFLVEYTHIWNLVDARYAKSIRWLEASGAEFYPESLVINGMPFQGFVVRRK